MRREQLKTNTHSACTYTIFKWNILILNIMIPSFSVCYSLDSVVGMKLPVEIPSLTLSLGFRLVGRLDWWLYCSILPQWILSYPQLTLSGYCHADPTMLGTTNILHQRCRFNVRLLEEWPTYKAAHDEPKLAGTVPACWDIFVSIFYWVSGCYCNTKVCCSLMEAKQ